MIMRRTPTAEDIGVLAIEIETLRREARRQNCEVVSPPEPEFGDPGVPYCSDECPEDPCTPCLVREHSLKDAKKLRAKQLRWITRFLEAKR